MPRNYKNTNICEAINTIPDLKLIGCVLQITTQQGHNISEALTFVPGVRIVEDINGGYKLVMS